MDALRVMDEQGIAEFEVRPEAMAAYNAQIQSKLPGTVWMSGCASWYLDADGQEHDDLAGLHVALPPPHAALRHAGLHAAPRRRRARAAQAVA